MNETILNIAANKTNWQEFLTYKLERGHLNQTEEIELRDFIERNAFQQLSSLWGKGQYPTSLPIKKSINKIGTKKKRIVYSFPGDEGIFLKFIAFHLFKYDYLFCNNCYAFRRDFGVRDAINRIRTTPGLENKHCLKVDISNYFNSIDVDILLSKLDFLREKDMPLYQLFTRILREKYVQENGRIISEKHGAMAGTPISPFFANVYLREVDAYFEEQNILYFRYSDDILIFADTREELFQLQNILYDKITQLKLTLNPDKVAISAPGEVWEFLGFCYRKGEIDLSDTTLRKIKAKIKRKANALRRWQRSKGLSSDKAAIGFIHAMNRKFYGTEQDSKEFTWSRWFFPNITTDQSLKIVDSYFQQYIRYTVTGRHYKGNYRIPYTNLKDWGYRSLLHEYYKSREKKH